MKYKKIREIFKDFTNTSEYANVPDFMTDESLREIEKYMKEGNMAALEDKVMSLICDAEQEGFVMGFRYAVQIMKDCF